jgi:hypothetical protein
VPTNSTISPGGRIEDRKGASKTYLRLVASPAFLSHKRELMERPPPIYFDISITSLEGCVDGSFGSTRFWSYS